MSNDPLNDERLEQDAAVAAAATDAVADSIDAQDVDPLDRLGEAAGFVQDDIEDAWERTCEIFGNIGAMASTVVRRAPAASIGLAFGFGYLLSRRRDSHRSFRRGEGG
jgi:hypothetical protein